MQGMVGVPQPLQVATVPVTTAYVTHHMPPSTVTMAPTALTMAPPMLAASPERMPLQVQGVIRQPVESYGLSINVGAPPDPEEGLVNLSPAERVAAKRRKKEELRQQLEQSPDDTSRGTLQKLARIFQELNEVDEFVAFAQDFCRRHRSSWRIISRVLRKFSRERDALQLLLEVHREEPHNAEVCIQLAKLDPNHRSRSWYEQALKADPRCIEALLAIADELRKVDRNFSEAARYYEAAHRQCPSTDRRLHFKTLRRMGECLVQLD